MIIRMILIIALLFCLGGCTDPNKKIPPKAVKGVLDLRSSRHLDTPESRVEPKTHSEKSGYSMTEPSVEGWDFETDSTINLDGDWEFYWNEFISPYGTVATVPDIPNSSLPIPHYINVPSQWQQHGNPADGYATYRLRILLPQLPKHGLSIKMTDTGTAYEMYINGKLASVNGKAGKSKDESIPYMRHSSFSIDSFLNESNTIDIIFYVSNYHYYKAGLWDTIKIGSSSEINDNAKQTFTLDLIVMSSLFIMGLYHLVLYLNRRKDSSPLYFGVFCILVALRTTSINERIILDLFPFIPFFIIHKLEYLTLYYGSFVFVQFVSSLFPDEFSKRWYIGFGIILLSCVLLIIVSPMSLYSRALNIVQLTILVGILYFLKVLIFAIFHKRMGSKLFLIGFILFAFTMVNDIVKTMGILFTPYMASYGLLTFVIFQAAILSRKFSSAFNQAEKLSEELEQKSNRLEETATELTALTENLEVKVQERTKDLEASKAEVEKLNKITKRINSVSSLTDVMTFIMFHLEKEYKFRDFWLLLKDESNDRLISFSYSSPGMSQDTYQYIMNLNISLNEENTFSTTFKEQKIFYLPLDENTNLSVIDKQIIEHGKFTFLLEIPFVVYDETIGILCIHNKSMEKLSDDLLDKLQNFSNQVAGAINNSKLFKQSQIAKEEADIEKGIAQVAQQEAETERHKSEKLLLNILPKDVAKELKEKGFAEPVLFESVSVMFTDFKGFTKIAETMSPQELIKDLDACFVQFDKITERYHLEKLKTIGDSYMCAGGIPRINNTHPIDIVLAALEIQAFMNQMKDLKLIMELPYWELRLGIHSGPLVAGVIGEKKFAYDVWGDTVNTASRMESSGTPGKINVSGATYELIKNYFDCEFRGMINAKNKGEVAMYYVNRLKEEYSKDEDCRVPNESFWKSYNNG